MKQLIFFFTISILSASANATMMVEAFCPRSEIGDSYEHKTIWVEANEFGELCAGGRYYASQYSSIQKEQRAERERLEDLQYSHRLCQNFKPTPERPACPGQQQRQRQQQAQAETVDKEVAPQCHVYLDKLLNNLFGSECRNIRIQTQEMSQHAQQRAQQKQQQAQQPQIQQ